MWLEPKDDSQAETLFGKLEYIEPRLTVLEISRIDNL